MKTEESRDAVTPGVGIVGTVSPIEIRAQRWCESVRTACIFLHYTHLLQAFSRIVCQFQLSNSQVKSANLIWLSHMPAAPCWPAGSWTFHSITIAPAANCSISIWHHQRIRNDSPGPLVVNIMSVISTTPWELAAPTLTTGCGLFMSLNAEPVPIMTDQASPTICVPAGIVMVEETRYVPWSKNMILHPAYLFFPQICQMWI